MSYPYPGGVGGTPYSQSAGYSYGTPQQFNQQSAHRYPYRQPGGMQGGWGQQQQQQQPPPAAAPPGVDPQIYQWFLAVDADRSGKITASELKVALVNGNWSHFSEDACYLMISMFDKDNSGTIDIMEFQSLWNYIQQWKALFERYDANRTGQIDQGELEKVLTDMGYRLSSQFVSQVIARHDLRKKGLTLDKFIVFCVHLRLLTDAFKTRDTNMAGVITIPYEDFLSVAMLSKP